MMMSKTWTPVVLLACFAAGARAAYDFSNADGESTVSYSGQTARLNQADAIYDALNSPDTTKEMLLSMYNDGTGFADAALGESGKNVGSKTAAGCLNGDNEAMKEKLVAMLTDYADNVVPNWDAEAADGSPGVLSDDKRTINVNAKGWEVDQVFQKSLIGAFALDQIVNHYLAACKLDAGTNQDDNCNGVTAEGKPYTKMEHAWDEAFGYLYGQEADPTRADLASNPGGDGTLLNEYLAKVNSGDVAPGIAQEVYDAFETGRQAIIDCDYETRDAQVMVIQRDLSSVIGAMVVNYLAQYLEQSAAGTPADAVHSLSEGYGFINGLPYTNDGSGAPYFTQEEVDGFLEKLDDFWAIDEADVLAIHDEVNSRFGFISADEGDGGEGGDDAGEVSDDGGDDTGEVSDDGGDDTGEVSDDG